MTEHRYVCGDCGAEILWPRQLFVPRCGECSRKVTKQRQRDSQRRLRAARKAAP